MQAVLFFARQGHGLNDGRLFKLFTAVVLVCTTCVFLSPSHARLSNIDQATSCGRSLADIQYMRLVTTMGVLGYMLLVDTAHIHRRIVFRFAPLRLSPQLLLTLVSKHAWFEIVLVRLSSEAPISH